MRVARFALGVLLGAAVTTAHAEEVVVFAAGSLRAPLTDVAHAFEQSSGNKVALTFGASGLLRDRIAGGERADVFASANMEHPKALEARGWTRRVERFARNRMCVLARGDVAVTPQTALATMLDPAVKLGTSTPKSDPSGDYAWKVFRKADRVQHGASERLSSKALKVTGGPTSPPAPTGRSVYGMLIESGDADVMLTYCTNAELAHRENAALHVVRLPKSLDVGADYGMAVRRDAPPAARAFAAFLRSREGQQHLRSYGFDPS